MPENPPEYAHEKRPRRKRRWLRWPAYGVLGLLVVLLAVFGLLQTPPAKSWLAHAISEVASASSGMEAEMHGLRGFLPFTARIDSFTMADDDGVYLQLENAFVDWSLRALLRGRVRIDELSASRLVLERLPKMAPREEPRPNPYGVPKAPAPPRWFSLDVLRIDELVLGEAVAGEAMTFQLAGHATTVGDAFELHFAVDRTDVETTRAQLDIAMTDDDFDMAFELEDETIAPVRGQFEAPLRITLEGAGPASAWQPTLRVSAGGETLMTLAESHLDLGPPLAMSGVVEVNTAHPLLAEAAAEYVDGPARLAYDFSLTPEGLLHVESAQLDAPPFSGGVSGDYDIAARRADINARAEHADLRELIPKLQSPAPQPVSVDISAEGPLEALVTDAKAHLSGSQAWSHRFTLKLTPPFGLQGDFEATPPPEVTPTAWAPLLEGGAEGNVDATYGPQGTLALNKLDLRGFGLAVSASGTANIPSSTMDIDATIDVANLSRYAELAGTPLAGRLTVDAHAAGDNQGLKAELQLQGDTLTAASAKIASVSLQANVGAADGWAQGRLHDVVLTASGAVSGAAYTETPAQDISLNLNAHSPDVQTVTIDGLRVSGPGLVLDAQGQVSAESREGTADFTLAAQSLEQALGPFGLVARGSVNLGGTVQFDGKAPSVTAKVSGEGHDLAGLPMDAEAMVGGQFQLDADVAYANGVADVREFKLDAPNVSANVQGAYAVAASESAMEGSITVKDLAPFEDVAGMPLGGAVDAAFTLAGPPNSLKLDAQALSDGLRVKTVQLEMARIDVAVEGLPTKPAGTADITMAADGKELDAQTRFSFEHPRLAVQAVNVRAGENHIEGKGAFNLETSAGEGALDAALTNLAYFGDLLSLDLGGTLTGKAEFNTGGPSPKVAVTAKAVDLISPWAKAESLGLDLLVRDPLGAASVDLTLDGTNIANQENRIDKVNLAAGGSLDSLGITGEWKGSVLYDTALSGSLDATVEVRNQALTLRTLEGTLGEYPFALQMPAHMAMNGGGFTTEPINLRFAEGGLRAVGGYSPSDVGFTATLEAFPLAVAGLAGGPVLLGTLSGEVSLGGTAQAPQAEASLQVAGFAMAGGPADAPPLDAQITVHAGEGQAEGQVTVQVPDAGEARAKAAVPVAFSLLPMAFSVAPDAPLSGALDANLDLAPLSRAYAAPDHIAKGQLDAAFRMAGSVSEPRVNGALTVENGRYENAMSGTILEDLQLAINAEGNRVVLSKLSATDGTGGSVSGTGQLEFTGDFPFKTEFTFDNARVVHRDDVSSRLSGPLRVAGNRKAIDVSGELVAGPALLKMPKRTGPPTLPQAAVVEINGPGQGAAGNEEESAQASAMPTVNLDISVEVPRKVYVRAPVLDSEWLGKLQITGTAQQPRIEGILRVYKGTLDFIGRQFNLADSTLSFDGSTEIMPYVNLVGRSETRTITGILRVEGKPAALQFTLDSEPSVPKDEVLSRLLFGRSVTDITPAQAVQLARVAMLLNQGMGGETLLSGGKGLGVVDNFSLSSGDDPGEAVVGVGKYITEDIYAEIETGTGGSTSTRVLFEFNPNFSAEAETSTTGQQGASVFWKKDY